MNAKEKSKKKRMMMENWDDSDCCISCNTNFSKKGHQRDSWTSLCYKCIKKELMDEIKESE